MKKEFEEFEEGREANIHLDNANHNTQVSLWRHTWILDLRIHVHPWQTGSETE